MIGALRGADFVSTCGVPFDDGRVPSAAAEEASTMGGSHFRFVALCVAAAGLAGCGQSNTYVAPPPPKVTVAKPVEQKVTRYFEATGNAAAVNSANLVARVQGFLTEIAYTDGQPVKKGDHLFTIEPEP